MANLKLTDVAKTYGGTVDVLKDINLDIKKGELIVFVGPSGCGKTTLLRIAAGLQTPSRGKVFLGSSLVSAPGGVQVPPEKRNVGLAFQESALFPHLTVLENVCFGISSMPKKQQRTRALELLGRLGMADAANVYPHTLSGGQQQRLCIARGVATKPEVLLLDEPTSALDPISTGAIEDLIEDLKQDYTIAIVTHNMQQAARISDYTAYMYLGDMVEIGKTDQVFTNPTQKATEDYITGRYG